MGTTEYVVQPVGLSPMEFKATTFEIHQEGVAFYNNNSLIYFAPNVNTKYVMSKTGVNIVSIVRNK